METKNTAISFSPNPATNVVRVSIPAEIHNNLTKLQEVQKTILGKLGCLACCSGWDIRFNVERQFIVDKASVVQEVIR